MRGVGRKIIVVLVYVNPEGVRVRETGRVLEVLQAGVLKYETEGFDVIVVGDVNSRIRLGTEEHPNSYGKRLLEVVRAGDTRGSVVVLCCQVDLGKWCEEGCNRLHVV